MTVNAMDEQQLVAAKAAIKDLCADTRAITQIIPGIIERLDPSTACDLMGMNSQDRTLWLPEALMLLNTPGLSDGQQRFMLETIFAANLPDEQSASALVRQSARIGSFGFSFPQWRYLTQSFNGASLVEHYGMKRLKRETDIADPALPDPQRDLFGTGFSWQDGPWSVEYRRAYVLCANHSEKDAAAVIIRNSSYFFGRDRLPAPALFSWQPLSAQYLRDLTRNELEKSGHFAAWENYMTAGQKLSLAEKTRRTGQVVDFLSDFDDALSQWLRSPHGGLPNLLSYFQHKLEQSSATGLPFMAAIDKHMPPWFPHAVSAVTPETLSELKTFQAGQALTTPELKTLFNAGDPSFKMVLLSGKKGDLPLGNKKAPQPA